jgi:hypothetical protein
MADRNSIHSTLRERIVEHVFVGEVLRMLWRRGITNVEVMRPEFDAHGYDLVMVRKKIVRHIQFKTGKSKNPVDVSVSRLLASAPSGCVIWIRVTDALDLGPFFWFGGAPGVRLPPIDKFEVPRRATRNKQGEQPLRLNHRLIPNAKFKQLRTLDDVLVALFGKIKR